MRSRRLLAFVREDCAAPPLLAAGVVALTLFEFSFFSLPYSTGGMVPSAPLAAQRGLWSIAKFRLPSAPASLNFPPFVPLASRAASSSTLTVRMGRVVAAPVNRAWTAPDHPIHPRKTATVSPFVVVLPALIVLATPPRPVLLVVLLGRQLSLPPTGSLISLPQQTLGSGSTPANTNFLWCPAWGRREVLRFHAPILAEMGCTKLSKSIKSHVRAFSDLG
ncbi:hypothetical protein BJX99DRAFT_254070 [Aspergillus californicus]